MNRTAARETVFRILFRYEFHDADDFPEQIETFFAEYPESDEDEPDRRDIWPEVTEADKQDILQKIGSVLAHIKEIDQSISEKCTGWSKERIGKAELSILRIAVYEIVYDEEIDKAVAISEAVKLSKKYCDTVTHSFVNGVLAKFS